MASVEINKDEAVLLRQALTNTIHLNESFIRGIASMSGRQAHLHSEEVQRSDVRITVARILLGKLEAIK